MDLRKTEICELILALEKQGKEPSATDIYKYLGMKNTYFYTLIKSLKKEGFVTEHNKVILGKEINRKYFKVDKEKFTTVLIKENSLNIPLEQGESVSEYAATLGITASALYGRLKRGWYFVGREMFKNKKR